MELLIRHVHEAVSRPIRALEIGVWYGVGSTNIWLNNLRDESKLVLLDGWRPYSSSEDLADHDEGWHKIDTLSTNAFLSTFLNVRKFEDESPKRVDISMIRGTAESVLPMFRDDAFDFIYIDGDHKYRQVKQDVVEAKRLISKEYGRHLR